MTRAHDVGPMGGGHQVQIAFTLDPAFTTYELRAATRLLVPEPDGS